MATADDSVGRTAAGPEDPGGRYWLVPAVGGTLLALWWLKGRGRRRSRS